MRGNLRDAHILSNNIRTRAGPGSLTYNYNSTTNRLSPITGAQSRSYSYDHRGRVTADGLASDNVRPLQTRPHPMTVQSPAQRATATALQHGHWAISNLKRGWLGTPHGAISHQPAPTDRDAFAFRYHRRKTHGIGRLTARALQHLVHTPPLTMKQFVHGSSAWIAA